MGEIQAVIGTADLIIVPTYAAPLDINRVWPTLRQRTRDKWTALDNRLTGLVTPP